MPSVSFSTLPTRNPPKYTTTAFETTEHFSLSRFVEPLSWAHRHLVFEVIVQRLGHPLHLFHLLSWHQPEYQSSPPARLIDGRRIAQVLRTRLLSDGRSSPGSRAGPCSLCVCSSRADSFLPTSLSCIPAPSRRRTGETSRITIPTLVILLHPSQTDRFPGRKSSQPFAAKGPDLRNPPHHHNPGKKPLRLPHKHHERMCFTPSFAPSRFRL